MSAIRQQDAPNDSYDVSFNNFRVKDIPGGFDTDNDSDGRDFLMWQRGLTPHALSTADLAEWKANYGSPLSALRQVPEPMGLGLLLVSGLLAAVGLGRSSLLR